MWDGSFSFDYIIPANWNNASLHHAVRDCYWDKCNSRKLIKWQCYESFVLCQRTLTTLKL